MDYFTKWAEVEHLPTLTTEEMKNFLWKYVVCRYEIPHALVTYNGTQFDCKPFRD
jgi:transposase InsO family protein